MPESSAMAREIAEIPAAAARQIARTDGIRIAVQRIRAFAPRVMVYCGRGSSGQVGVFLRYLFEVRLGMLVSAAAPSIVTAYHARPDMRGALFIVISQSGRSPDLVTATARARELGALTLAIVNDAGAPAARAAELVLPINAGPEQAVAATKTVALSMLAGARLVATLADDAGLADAISRLPARFADALACDWSPWTDALAAASAAFVTARGFALASAREIALKLTESLRLPSLAFSAAELRHGPRAAVTETTPVLALRPNDEPAPSVDELVRDLKASAASVFVAGGDCATLPWIGDDHPVCDSIAMLMPAYRAIESAARHLGLDPDHPPHLAKVTQTL
ncbi:MAG TPA: SIS domain-containing protein [Rhizomicrobium sp.]|jgi:glucosamine--fructose-6-phosphate aminotransferase (isomerizing)|nr:SIS domain-containing protein [Rhizomicrobium sp.]